MRSLAAFVILALVFLATQSAVGRSAAAKERNPALKSLIVSLKPRPLAVDQKRFDRSVVYKTRVGSPSGRPRRAGRRTRCTTGEASPMYDGNASIS